LWNNTWETGRSNINSATGDDNIISITSAKRLAAIPNLGVRYKDIFLSGGYFNKTHYKFPDYSIAGTRFSTTADRKETDINLGWFLVPNLALTIGGKWVKQEFETTSMGLTTDSSTKYRGVTGGIVGFAPIGSGFAFYGNGSGGPTKAKFDTGESSSGWYTSSEFGLAYALLKGAVATWGYKYQVLNTKISDQTHRDVTAGFTSASITRSSWTVTNSRGREVEVRKKGTEDTNSNIANCLTHFLQIGREKQC